MNVDTSQRGGWSYHWNPTANMGVGSILLLTVIAICIGLLAFAYLQYKWPAKKHLQPLRTVALRIIPILVGIAMAIGASAIPPAGSGNSAKEMHLSGRVAEYQADLVVPAPASVVAKRYKEALKKTYGLDYVSGADFHDYSDGETFYDFDWRDTEILAKDAQGRLNSCRTEPQSMGDEWVRKVTLFCTPEVKASGEITSSPAQK